MKTCKKCGINFYPTSNRNDFCGSCRAIVCKWCGRIFIPKYGNYKAKYCRKRCFEDSKIGKEPDRLANNRGCKPRTYHLTNPEKYGNMFDREWRLDVLKRDNYTCVVCCEKNKEIQVHHIKPYREYPELRHTLSNGQTLCKSCHIKTDTYGWKKYWNKIAAKRIEAENRQLKLF